MKGRESNQYSALFGAAFDKNCGDAQSIPEDEAATKIIPASLTILEVAMIGALAMPNCIVCGRFCPSWGQLDSHMKVHRALVKCQNASCHVYVRNSPAVIKQHQSDHKRGGSIRPIGKDGYIIVEVVDASEPETDAWLQLAAMWPISFRPALESVMWLQSTNCRLCLLYRLWRQQFIAWFLLIFLSFLGSYFFLHDSLLAISK